MKTDPPMMAIHFLQKLSEIQPKVVWIPLWARSCYFATIGCCQAIPGSFRRLKDKLTRKSASEDDSLDSHHDAEDGKGGGGGWGGLSAWGCGLGGLGGGKPETDEERYERERLEGVKRDLIRASAIHDVHRASAFREPFGRGSAALGGKYGPPTMQ